MNDILNRLSRIFDNSKVISYDDNSKFILMSDCHRGTGGFEDNFSKNQKLYSTALKYYYDDGYTYIELGDGDELWENRKINHIINEYRNIFYLLRKFYKEKRLYFIYSTIYTYDNAFISFLYKNLQYTSKTLVFMHFYLMYNMCTKKGEEL